MVRTKRWRWLNAALMSHISDMSISHHIVEVWRNKELSETRPWGIALRKQIPMSVCYLEQFCPSPASTLWIGKLKADLSLLLCILHFLWHTSLTVSQKGCKIQEKAGKAALPLHFCSCTMKTDTKCRGSTLSLSSCPIFTFEIRYFLEIKIKNPHSKTFGSFSAPCAFWIKAVS